MKKRVYEKNSVVYWLSLLLSLALIFTAATCMVLSKVKGKKKKDAAAEIVQEVPQIEECAQGGVLWL